MNAILVKTAQGRAEMGSRALGLPMLERRLLILVDGKRTLAQLQGMVNVPVLELASKLQALGLIETLSPGQRQATFLAGSPAPAKPALIAKLATAPSVKILAEPIGQEAPDIGVDVDIDAVSADDLASDFAEEYTSDWLDGAGDVHVNDRTEGDTQPGMLVHREATSVGLIAGKGYLLETVESMLAVDGAWLQRKISDAKTEAELYYALEQLVTTIGVYTSQSSVKGIVHRFEEKISQR
jgi:hypothetical protein